MIGVDVGGTFPDLIWADTDTGAQVIHKVPFTPENTARAEMTGTVKLCALAGIAPASVDFVRHGTTIATNAVLEHRGARTGMITNDGFRDVLPIARHQRVEHCSIRQELPWQSRPRVRRQHRKTVPCRLIPPMGAQLVPLDEAAVAQAARELLAEGVEAVCICLLLSYLNPAHEQHAAEITRAQMPGVYVTTPATISPTPQV